MISISRARRAAACVLLAASTAACATVTRGTSQAWTVQSKPSGAAIRTTNGFYCDATPCTFKMPRNSTFEVTVTKDGYKTYRGSVVHQVGAGGGAGMAGNVLVGGLIGAGVDVATGAMMDLKPNPLIVELEAVAPTPLPAVAASAVAPAALAVAEPVPAKAPAANCGVTRLSTPGDPGAIRKVC